MPDIKMEENEEEDDYHHHHSNYHNPHHLSNFMEYERMEDDEEEEEDEGMEDGENEDVGEDVDENGRRDGRNELFESNTMPVSSGSMDFKPKIPIMKDGMATCIRCGNVGVKDTFYGKGKQYCSGNCVRGLPPTSTSKSVPLFKVPTSSSSSSPLPLTPANAAALRKVTADLNYSQPKMASTPVQSKMIKVVSGPIKSTTRKMTTSGVKAGKINSNRKGIPSIQTQPKNPIAGFDWMVLLKSEPDLMGASVSSFKHAAMSETWDALVTTGLKVEVRNTDVSIPGKLNQEFYWIAGVIKIAGYFVLLRYEGYGTDSSEDFWINIFTTQVHPVGWCASQKKVLTPPKSVQARYGDWKGFLIKRLTGSRTLPENFYEQVKESLKSRFSLGMKLEVVDKKRISAVRVATIDRIVGGRIHISYEGAEEGDNGFWSHENSPLIHPVGWAQSVGHELKATQEYARMSLDKAKTKLYDSNEADWSYFVPLSSLPSGLPPDLKFKEGMKLEAIDPLNLSTICVATVTKVLRGNHLMIGIDGMMAMDGSDWFCYHASSPCIFPVGFCMLNKIDLTPPRGYDKEFKWFHYLKDTKSIAAPVPLFKKDIPNHGFREGMFVEAVDLMDPRLICVATIVKVVGRLIRVHFNGWDESYDQWCDSESPDIFPMGWSQVIGYPLEPPRDSDSYVSSGSNLNDSFSSESSNKSTSKKRPYGMRRRRRRRHGTGNGVPEVISSSPVDTQLEESNISTEEWISTTPSAHTTTCPMSNSCVVVKPSPIIPLGPDYEKMSKLSSNAKDWSVMNVSQFLKIHECGAYSQTFLNKKIDGHKLLQLSREDILELTNMKVGPSLKLHALIQSLKRK